MTTMTIQDRAREYASWFETAERPDGSTFTRLRAGAPHELSDLALAAHGMDRDGSPTFLPDNYRYRFTWDALAAIADMGEEDEPSEYAYASCDSETDIMNRDLLDWVGSNLLRAGYVDEAVTEFNAERYPGFYDALRQGQFRERLEVFEIVLGELGV